MMKSVWCLAVLVVSAWLAVSCVGPAGPIVVFVTATPLSATATPLPATATPLPATPTPLPATPTPARETTRLNLNEFFPPGEGQDLVFQNCGNCHNLGAIVVVQFTEEQWQTNANCHWVRFTGLSEEDFETIYNYLKTHFYPGQQRPDIPEEFLSGWPAY